MKIAATALAAAAVLWAHAATTQAQEGAKGGFFYNGLAMNIVEAHMARNDKCDIFKCGQWERVDNPDRVLPPHTEAALFKLPSGDPTAERACKWDIKLITQPPEGGALEEHVFRFIDFCPPRLGATVSFTQGRFNIFAVQVYTDENGKQQSMTYAAVKRQ